MPKPRQLLVLHLSDIHFGDHCFDPPAGDTDAAGYPTMLAKVLADLAPEDPGCPVLIALTGDFAQKATFQEFKRAEEFVRELADADVLGRKRGLESIFVVPGNHDVNFLSADMGERWNEWTNFYNRLYGTQIDRNRPQDFAGVHDRVEDLGAVVVTLNSSIYVQKDRDEEVRGRIDPDQIGRIEDELAEIDPDRLASAIKVALIHHHPVLIPPLVESGRGYDAVHNAGLILTRLRRAGFHLLLHGHKHNPHVFTEDSSSAYVGGESQPILIAAGGSAASLGLPTSPRCGNCYNQIVVKWDPDARQARIRVATRGLLTFDDDGNELLPTQTKWETMRIEDRQFLGGGERAPQAGNRKRRPFDEETDGADEERRKAEYARVSGHFPVAEVMQSLIPGQAYEARVWIVRHAGAEHEVERVKWSAGPKFPVVTVEADEDPNMCAAFHYWGPMLIEAQMEYNDGSRQQSYVYARLPGELGSK